MKIISLFLCFSFCLGVLISVPISNVWAQSEDVVLDVSDELEPLEAEKFDDEVPDADFEDIDDSEFQDIDNLGNGSGESEEIPPEIVLDESVEEPAVDDFQTNAVPDEVILSDPSIEDGGDEIISDGAEDPNSVDDTADILSDPALSGATDEANTPDIAEEPVEPPGSTSTFGSEAVVTDSILNDEPDNGFESRLHDIFEQYYKAPISNEEWAQIAGDKQKEVYSVVQGDSLWEISEVFFGDGNYWPKVWSFNSSITNPHVIEIGDRIAFYPGDEENPPKVVIEQKSEPVQAEMSPDDYIEEEVAYEDTPIEEEYYGESGEVLDIPEPSKRYVPVLRSIPPSLPSEKPKFFEGFDDSGFAVSERRFSRSEVAEMRLTSFIAEEVPETIGEIKELPSGQQMAQLYEPIYLQMESGAQGDIVTAYVVKEEGEDEKDLSYEEGKVIEYQGEIELQDVVNDELNLYRGLVISLVNKIEVGSKITAGPIPKVNVSNIGETVSAQANLIGGEYDDQREALGVGSVVYLNAGSQEGIQPESIVGILANEKLRNEQTEIKVNSREIGRVKIAKVENSVSTGVIVYASSAISKGDFAGQAQVSQLGAESFGDDDSFSEEDFGGDVGEGDIEDDLNEAFEDEGDFSDEALEDDGFSDEDFGDEFGDDIGDASGEELEGGLGDADFSDEEIGAADDISDEDFGLEDDLNAELGGDEFSADDFSEDDLDDGGLEDDDLSDDFSDEELGGESDAELDEGELTL